MTDRGNFSKDKVSSRYLVEFKISLGLTRLSLDSHVLFKRILKVGKDFVLVVESMGNKVDRYLLDIVSRDSLTLVPTSARYIDSVALADGRVVHFFAQPIDASTDGHSFVSEDDIPVAEVRRPDHPPREETVILRMKESI